MRWPVITLGPGLTISFTKPLPHVHQKTFTKFTNYYCFNNLRIAPNHQKPILCSVRPNQSEISPVSTFPWSNSSSPLHPKLFGAVGIFAGSWKWSLVKSPNFPCISLIKTIVMYNNGAYLWKSPIFGAKKQSHQYLQLLIFANSIFATKNICYIKIFASKKYLPHKKAALTYICQQHPTVFLASFPPQYSEPATNIYLVKFSL